MEEDFLKDIIKIFTYYRHLGETAMKQLKDSDLFISPEGDGNSIAVLVKHLSGNMQSRWTDFLSSDGEKEWRDRDSEFVPDITSREQMMALWNKGWDLLFSTLDSLDPSDMRRTIYIRNTGHSVSEAINRQLAHYAYHVGQLVFLAKQLCKEDWISLSIPKGASKDFNKKLFSKKSSKRHFTDDL
jgi:hypothetical protein